MDETADGRKARVEEVHARDARGGRTTGCDVLVTRR
jgi:hypothetical protein